MHLLEHWSRLTDNSQPTIPRGTVMETIDEMMDWYHLEYTKPEVLFKEGDDDIPEDKKLAMYVMKNLILKDYEKPSNVNVGDTVKYKDEDGIEYDAKVCLTDDVKHVKCKISDTIVQMYMVCLWIGTMMMTVVMICMLMH